MTATAKEFAGIYRGKKQHEPDFESTLERASSAGVKKVMLTGMSLDDIDFNTAIARARPKQCFITIGIHPYHAAIDEIDLSSNMNRLSTAVNGALAQQPRLVSAFGELGLDYDRLNHASKEDQIRAFIAQLDLMKAHQWPLPLFLHCRAAVTDFVEIISPYLPHLPRGGVVHSFVGSIAEMQQLLDLGLDVSVNGFSFQTRESVGMVAALPLRNLHLETDAPWGEVKASSALAKRYLVNAPSLPASKKRDKHDPAFMVKERNESSAISVVAYTVAGIKGISVEEVANAAWENSVRMFGFEEL